LSFLFLFLNLTNSNLVFSESSSVQEINIELKSASTVFNLESMVPGDFATRDIIVNNNGKEAFNYLLKSNFISGSKKFYNSLQLIISADDEELYKGKLSDFNKIPPRHLEIDD